MPAIPITAEEVTVEWMQSILPDVCVEKVDVKPAASKGDNFAVIVVRADVEGQKNQQPYHQSFVLKIMPFQNWHRKMVIEIKVFEREVCAYQQVLPDYIKKQTQERKLYPSAPKCIHTDMEEQDGVIVLEDLKPQGYILNNMRKGQDYDHCILVMEELAKFHALGYNIKYSSKVPLKDMYPDLGEPLFVLAADTFASFWGITHNRTVETLKMRPNHEPLVECVEKLTNNFKESITEAFAPIEPYSTLCHGDSWNSNMMFKYDDNTGKPVSLKLIDFQGVAYCSPTADLSYYFFTSVKGPLRKKHLKDFLRYYHDKLFEYLNILGVTEINKNNFSLDKLYELYYKQTASIGLIQGLNMIPMVFVPKDDFPDFHKIEGEDFKDIAKGFDEDIMDKMNDALKNNPEVLEHTWYMFEEAHENGVRLG